MPVTCGVNYREPGSFFAINSVAHEFYRARVSKCGRSYWRSSILPINGNYWPKIALQIARASTFNTSVDESLINDYRKWSCRIIVKQKCRSLMKLYFISFISLAIFYRCRVPYTVHIHEGSAITNTSPWWRVCRYEDITLDITLVPGWSGHSCTFLLPLP